MKFTFRRTAVAIFAAAMVCSCIWRDLSTPDTVLRVFDLQVPADIEIGDVSATLPVWSNMSWTARLEGNVDWISAEGIEHVNPSNVTDSAAIKFSFADNDSTEPRTASMKFFGRGYGRKITITQTGKNPRIRIIGEETRRIEAEPSSQVEVNILSNIEWKAGIEEGSTASVSLDGEVGERDGTVLLKFAPNYNIDKELSATLTVSGVGVETKKVTFVQAGNVPFVRVIANSTDSIVNPNKTTAKVTFRANSKWTAKVLESTIGNFKLDKESGEAGYVSLNPTFDENKGEQMLKAKIEIALNDYPDARTVVTLAQKFGRVIELTFPKGSTDWTPNLPTTTKTDFFSGQYTYTPANYSLVFHVLADGKAFCLFDNTSLCFSYGSTTTSWIEFPCIPDYKLSSLTLHTSNTAGKQTYYIYDAIDNAGNLGTSMAKSAQTNPAGGVTTIAWGETTPWTTSPVKDQTVFLYQKAQNNAKVDNITLIYTKE